MSAGDPTDTRCRFVHPPEAIRCVRTVQRGTLACDMHQGAIGAPSEGTADRGPAPGVYSADQFVGDRVAAISHHVDELVRERVYQLSRRLEDMEARLAAEKRASDRLAQLVDHQAIALAGARSLEGALQVLGITRGQLDAGQAVDLCGHPYVSRDLLGLGNPGPVDAEAPGPLSDTLPRLNVEGTALMSEAAGGVFVPIPEGHMLSVTVTPYAAD